MKIYNNKNSSNFSDRSKIGLEGEEICKAFFKLKNIDFEDVSNNEKYQKIDIDFLINVNEDIKTVETKTLKDMIKKSNKIMVKYNTVYINEDMKNKKQNDAWLNTSKAQYIIFVCKASKRIIMVNFKKLKEYIETYKDTYYIGKQKFFDEDKEHGGKYDRYNYVYYINLNHLEKELNKDKKTYLKEYLDMC